MPVHRTVDYEWSGDRSAAQASNEGRRFPMAMRRFAEQSLAPFAAPARPDHICRRARLVEKDELFRIKRVLSVFPFGTRLRDVRAILLGGVQSLF